MLLDAFMKIEGGELTIEGESTDSLHANEIEIISFEQTVTRLHPAGQGKGGTADLKAKVKPAHSPLTVLKPLDKATPKLLEAASRGVVYPKVILSLCQPKGHSDTASSSWAKTVYLELTLEQVHFARVHFVGDPRLHYMGPFAAPEVMELGPMEAVDLAYQKIQWAYKGADGSANFTGSWNLLTNSTR